MTIQYVGGVAGGRAGATSTTTQSLSATLTGGLASTPSVGDFVVVSITMGTVGRTPSTAISSPSGFSALGTQINANGTTNDCCLGVYGKFYTGTGDNTITIPSTGNVADAQRWNVQVFRGVSQGSPQDVLYQPAQGTGTSRPNPAAITPSTANSIVYVAAAGAAGTGAAFTFSGLSNVIGGATADTTDAVLASGWTTWTSGAVDIAVSSTGEAVASDSWAAMTFAFRDAASTTPGADIDLLSDDFQTDTVSAGSFVWDTDIKYEGSAFDSGASVTWDNSSRVKFLATSAGSFDSDGRLRSKAGTKYDPTAGSIYFAFQVGAGGGGTYEFGVALHDSTNEQNFISMLVQEGTFYKLISNNGTLAANQSAVAYDPVAHYFWRIRGDGSNFFFEAAPKNSDGTPGTFVNVLDSGTPSFSQTFISGWDVTNCAVRFRRRNFQALSAPGDFTVYLESVNATADVVGGGAAKPDPLFMLSNMF